MKKKKYSKAAEHPLFRRWTWMRWEHMHKGIELEWDSFWHFAEDIESTMGLPPEGERLRLCRKDHNQGYILDNLFWGDHKEQGARYHNVVRLTYKKRTQTIKQWADELNMNYGTLYTRYKQGWSTQDILTRPLQYVR